MNKHIQSSFNLLSNIRIFNLSTHDPDTDSVWSSTLFYIPQYNPLKLIWYSKQNTRHSRELHINPRVSGTIYRSLIMPDSSLDLAGCQFVGYARQVPDEQLQETHDHFFLNTFPDENIRKKKARPISDYQGQAERRFYELEIQAWWVYDSDAWTLHKDDDCVQVPLGELLASPMFTEK